MLKRGEYDVWASEMKVHIMSIDVECWRIKIDIDVMFEKTIDAKVVLLELKEYIEECLKKVEKNFKALKFITSGRAEFLCQKEGVFQQDDQEQVDALEKIYKGPTLSNVIGLWPYYKTMTT